MNHELNTVLFTACRKGNTTTINNLLAAKANIEATDHTENTPLRYAVASKSPATVKLLLKLGADVKAKNIYQITAIKGAINLIPYLTAINDEANIIEIIKDLILYGIQIPKSIKYEYEVLAYLKIHMPAEFKLELVRMLLNHRIYYAVLNKDFLDSVIQDQTFNELDKIIEKANQSIIEYIKLLKKILLSTKIPVDLIKYNILPYQMNIIDHKIIINLGSNTYQITNLNNLIRSKKSKLSLKI